MPNNRGLNGKKDGRYRQRESLLAPTTNHGGNVVLFDVFQSDGELGLKVEDMLAMPVEIVRLVTPLANLVDQKLAEEVRNLDKSKRKKGNKTTSPGE